jgi:hypothetical protein
VFDSTVTTAATILVQDAPETSSGITAVTNPYSILVLNGTSRFEGKLESSNAAIISGGLQTGITTFAGATPVTMGTTNRSSVVVTGTHTTTKQIRLPDPATILEGTIYTFTNESLGLVEVLNYDTSTACIVEIGESKRVIAKTSSTFNTLVPGSTTWTPTTLATSSVIINQTALSNLFLNSTAASSITHSIFRAPSLTAGTMQIQVGKNSTDYGLLGYTYTTTGSESNRIWLGTSLRPESLLVYGDGTTQITSDSLANHTIIVSNSSSAPSVKMGLFLAPSFSLPGSSYVVMGQSETAYNAFVLSFNAAATSSPLNYLGIGMVGGLDPTIKVNGTGITTFVNTTDTTSLITGSTYFSGGAVFEKNISVGGNVGIHGFTSGRVSISSLTGTWDLILPSTAGTSGQVLTSSGGSQNTWTTPTTGTVTSVNLTAPSFLTVGGTVPITTSGTIALTYSGVPLPVLNGGTGTTTSTGTGSNVLSISPTFTGTASFDTITTVSAKITGVSASSALQTDASKDLITISNTGTGMLIIYNRKQCFISLANIYWYCFIHNHQRYICYCHNSHISNYSR